MVYVGDPVTEKSFNGDQGYAWEFRPISISEHQAVIDFRVKHFDYFAPAADMRAQLKQSEFPPPHLASGTTAYHLGVRWSEGVIERLDLLAIRGLKTAHYCITA